MHRNAPSPAYFSIARGWQYHLLFWCLYVVSELAANWYHYPVGRSGELARNTLLSLPILLVATYFIAGVLVPRLLRTRRYWLFSFFTLLTAVAVLWGRVYWLSTIEYLETGRFYTYPPSKTLKNVIRDYSVIGLAVCLMIISDWRRKDRLSRQLYQAKSEAELQLLRGQLHPHFLFNTLNNLYGLALRNSEKTADSILKLSAILDYLLYLSNSKSVPLVKEAELIRNYCDLEKLRYGEQLQLSLSFPEELPEIPVAPLLFLPFVENCFKHGGKDERGIFRIHGKICLHDGHLSFYLTNTVKKSTAGLSEQPGGLGLQNLRQRLALLYPRRHHLKTERKNGLFRVDLNIQLDQMPALTRNH